MLSSKNDTVNLDTLQVNRAKLSGKLYESVEILDASHLDVMMKGNVLLDFTGKKGNVNLIEPSGIVLCSDGAFFSVTEHAFNSSTAYSFASTRSCMFINLEKQQGVLTKLLLSCFLK